MQDTGSETWRPVPGYDGYEVSDLGRVRSQKYKSPRLLKLHYTKRGYASVSLCDLGTPKTLLVHGLIMLAFVGPRPTEATDVAHNNGDPKDNRLANLRYDTHHANMLDSIEHGTTQRGTRHVNSVLDEQRVRDIRRLRSSGASTPHLAKLFGVSHGAIHGVISGRSWRWLA